MSDLYAHRSVFDAEHEEFRAVARTFVAREVTDHVEAWEENREVPRSAWLAAGAAGLFGFSVPEEYGGAGIEDYRYRCVLVEELTKVGATSFAAGLAVHTDIVIPYLVDLATPEQAARWLPAMVEGRCIGAIAMTEPGAGSDLKGVRTTAVRSGEGWVLNGTKTFISNGINCGLAIIVAKTSPEGGSKGFSLFVVEEGTPGFSKGTKLRKLGLHAQDTAELVLEDVYVGPENLLGVEGGGLGALMSHLPLERLNIAFNAVAAARAALAWTIEYVGQREAFGQPLSALQNTQFEIADMVTDLEVTQCYLDQAVLQFNAGRLTAVDAAKAKLFATQRHQAIVDRCLQLHGGYGFMLEYPIARAYADTRVTTIFGGTSEIMKVIIARDVLGVR